MTRGTQQRIRDAALGLLIAEGVPGFSIDEICRRSGIAKTTIYRHWPSVHDLLVDTVAMNVTRNPGHGVMCDSALRGCGATCQRTRLG